MRAPPPAAGRVRFVVALLVALTFVVPSLAACRKDRPDGQPASSGRGVAPPGVFVDPTSPPRPLPRWQDPMLPHKSEVRRPMVHVEPSPLTETITTPAAALPGPPPRDYPAELRTRAGDVSSCVTPEELAALPERVEADLEAYVTPNGLVSRADVRSGTLPQSALACLRARIGAAHFAAPVNDAPRQIRAHLVLDRRAVPPE